MNYDITEEQQRIKAEAQAFLASECTGEYVRAMVDDERGFSPDVWKKMAEMGWMGLLIPEQYGGYGGDFLDLMVLLSEMGYAASPGPFFSTVVLGGLSIIEAGSDPRKPELLSALAKGDRLLSLAWIEEEGLFTPEAIRLSADREEDAFVLSGTKVFVPDANIVDILVTAARTGDNPADISLFLVDAKSPGLSITPLVTMAGDKQCEVVFDKVRVPGGDLLGELNLGLPVLKKIQLMAAVAKCAEMMGGARRAFDLILPWAKERVQFDRPIGSFQAIQHYCSDIVTYLDTLTFMTYKASWLIAAGKPFEKEASMCKAYVGDSYRKLVALGHQVMGGLAFMEEHDLGLYFKRAKAAELFFGDADFHRELVAQQMGL